MNPDELETIHKELAGYEKSFEKFKIVGLGENSKLTKHSGEIPNDLDMENTDVLQEQLIEVRNLVKNFRVIGSGISGSFDKNYVFRPPDGVDSSVLDGQSPPLP